MKKGFIRSKKARYGGMTVLLTVLLITAVVLFNVLFTTLAERYTWYADMRGETDFSVTDRCYTLLDAVLGQNDADVRILFCDTPVNLQEEVTSRYVYDTASEIAGRFPDRIRIECHNIWLNPDSVRQYTSTLNPETGEQMDVALKSTSVIIVSGDKDLKQCLGPNVYMWDPAAKEEKLLKGFPDIGYVVLHCYYSQS